MSLCLGRAPPTVQARLKQSTVLTSFSVMKWITMMLQVIRTVYMVHVVRVRLCKKSSV